MKLKNIKKGKKTEYRTQKPDFRILKVIWRHTIYEIQNTAYERRVMEIFLDFSGRHTEWFV
jgi:hypothetical protein